MNTKRSLLDRPPDDTLQGREGIKGVLLGLWLIALTSSCTEPDLTAEIRLAVVGQYGSEAPASLEAGSDPGALGSVHGMVEGPDGAIYVLDGMNRRVVIFEADGTFRSEFGSFGEGPGEFRWPGQLALEDGNRLVVWDDGLGRLSTFSLSGEFTRSIQGLDPAYRSMAVASDTVWFVRPVSNPGSYAVFGIELARGEAVDSFAPLNDQQASISGFGWMGAVARGPSDELIFAGPLPTELLVRSSRGIRRAGRNRYPTARGTEEEINGIIHRYSPVGVRDVTILPSGEIVVLYETGLPPTGEGPKKTWLELMDSSGKSLGRVDLGEGFYSRLSTTRDGHLLLGATVDVPLVRRLRIERPD